MIPHQDTIGTFTGDDYDWADFDALKDLHFGLPRRRAFHYAISVHQLGSAPNFAGLSRGVDDGASDFVISQGRIVGGNDTTAAAPTSRRTRSCTNWGTTSASSTAATTTSRTSRATCRS